MSWCYCSDILLFSLLPSSFVCALKEIHCIHFFYSEFVLSLESCGSSLEVSIRQATLFRSYWAVFYFFWDHCHFFYIFKLLSFFFLFPFLSPLPPPFLYSLFRSRSSSFSALFLSHSPHLFSSIPLLHSLLFPIFSHSFHLNLSHFVLATSHLFLSISLTHTHKTVCLIDFEPWTE